MSTLMQSFRGRELAFWTRHAQTQKAENADSLDSFSGYVIARMNQLVLIPKYLKPKFYMAWQLREKRFRSGDNPAPADTLLPLKP
jgi:hypothetical protein